MDLAAYLAGGNNLEQMYQAQDPFMQAARGIAQVQYSAPRSNAEAFLLPFLQNSIAGGFSGYGKSNAKQTAYGDISSMLGGMGYQPENNVLRSALEGAEGPVQPMYGQELAPEGWSTKIGMQDLLLANSAQQAQLEAAAKKQEIIDKFTVESSQPYLDMIQGQEQSKARGKLLGETPDFVSGSVNPVLANIQSKVPKDLQNTAIKEKGTIDKLETGFKRIDELMTLGEDAAKDPSTLLPSSLSIPFVGKIADLPSSEAKKVLDTVSAGITSVALSVWKGPLDEKDAKRILDPYIPTLRDTEKTLAQKREGLKNLLLQNAESTPTLEGYNIAKRPSVGSQQAVPAGMKLQRNKVTGETRLVPQ